MKCTKAIHKISVQVGHAVTKKKQKKHTRTHIHLHPFTLVFNIYLNRYNKWTKHSFELNTKKCTANISCKYSTVSQHPTHLSGKSQHLPFWEFSTFLSTLQIALNDHQLTSHLEWQIKQTNKTTHYCTLYASAAKALDNISHYNVLCTGTIHFSWNYWFKEI